ncbi:hypothetical protein FB45DRAFT_860810 [Roridomyces roridus]|uniref:GST C-terminal domain-containing protein n=1 Tax=Roridomyces roridus TaxID=1738132 RepID=A0AAD7G0W2_9AGAR|nr:hypothetical protein FB45DRAFT_860810 [Roridomyces roridus]
MLPLADLFPHATGAASKTVEAHQDPQDLVFYAAWRSWITLEEKGIPYQYKEVNPYKKEKHFLGRLSDAQAESPPEDPYSKAYARIWVDYVGKAFVPAFMRLLMTQGTEKQDAARAELYDVLRKFSAQIKGPYFLGEHFSLVDIAIAPWIPRDVIAAEHRGYSRDQAGAQWKRYAEHVEQRESVLRTRSDKDKCPGQAEDAPDTSLLSHPEGRCCVRPCTHWYSFLDANIARKFNDLGTAIDALLTRWKEPPDNSNNGEEPPLRPRWIRLSVCSMELFTGLLIATSLLIHRSRTTTLLAILPPKTPNTTPTPLNRRIFIQTCGNWRTNGTIYPLSACTLTRVEKNILFLQIKGEYSGWQLNIDKSVVDGRPVGDTHNEEKACRTVSRLWNKAGGKGTILTSLNEK